jgi:small subunit ribosomal protein S21
VNFVVEVKRKDGESFESLLRRFNRKIQQSGILVRARRIQFFEPRKSRNLIRESARRRNELAEERENLRRMGKLPVFRGSRRGGR